MTLSTIVKGRHHLVKSETIAVRLSPETKASLEKAAAAAERSVSSYAEQALRNAARPDRSWMTPPHVGHPEDGIGYLSVTITYEAVDRENIKSITQAFRVRKGPLLPKRTVVRSRVQHDLDAVLDWIDQIEIDEVPKRGAASKAKP